MPSKASLMLATPPTLAPQDKLARLEAPTTAVQPLSSQALWLVALCSAARQFPDWRQRRAGFEQCLEARQDFWPAMETAPMSLESGLSISWVIVSLTTSPSCPMSKVQRA